MQWKLKSRLIVFRRVNLPCLVSCLLIAAAAQSQTVYIPQRGGTPLSYQIEAEASYMAAYGNMTQSVATARKINAEAVALEIQNSVDYVKAYFERREINRQEVAKLDPNYLERETRRQAVLKRRVETQYQDILRGDVTRPLNWLLRELSSPVVAYQYLPGSQTLLHSQLDPKLSPRDLEQLRLTDGGGKTSHLVFAAADGKVLHANWPLALRSEQFAGPRTDFEKARDDVLKEVQDTGKTTPESQAKLMQTLNAMFVALEDAYPKEVRKDPEQYLTYSTAKRFLQAALATSHRALSTNDPFVLGGGLRFQGDSVVGLVQHMYQNGLEFAPPEPGGEGVYKSLFQSLRTLYTNIGSDRSPDEVLRRAGGGEMAPAKFNAE
jgi:hypothetical protein